MKWSILRLWVIVVYLCSTHYGCFLKESPEETNPIIPPVTDNWTFGETASYPVSSTINSKISDPLSGSTYIFPDGGSGTLRVTKVNSGPSTTKSDAVFQVEYSGSGKIQLQMTGKVNEQLLIGYCPLSGSGILVDEAPKGLQGVWIPLPEKDGGNGTLIFDLPVAQTFSKVTWAGISNYKKLDVSKIKDADEKFEKLIREVANTLINAIPASKQQEVKDLINGNLMPQVYVNTDVTQACYKPFWDWFGIAKRKIFMFNPNSSKNNVAHEFGHYMHHVLTGGSYTNFANNPRGSDHAVGENGAKNNIIEEPAYFSEYYCTGLVGTKNLSSYDSKFDPEQGTFCIEARQTGGSNNPISQDFLDVEGFGVMLMASVCRTKISITDYKDQTVEVPVIQPAITDRKSFFQDMYGIIESGENSIPGIAENIVYLAQSKWGGKEAVKKLQLMWKPLGYVYTGVIRFLDKDNKPLKGVTAQDYITIDNKEYLLKKNINSSGANGEYTLSEIFPGNSSLRIYYTNSAGESKILNLQDQLTIGWDAPTDVSIKKDIIVDDENLLPYLNKTVNISIGFKGMCSNNNTRYPGDREVGGLITNYALRNLIWNNQNFSISTSFTKNDECNLENYTISISGTFSSDGKTIEKISATQDLESKNQGCANNPNYHEKIVITGSNIPFLTDTLSKYYNKSNYSYFLSGNVLQSRSTFSYTYTSYWTLNQDFPSWEVIGVNWNYNKNDLPYIWIKFVKK